MQTLGYCQLLLINFMSFIIDLVNLVVIGSNRNCFYLFYGSCQGYLVCSIALSVFLLGAFLALLFYNRKLFLASMFRLATFLIDTSSIFNNFAGLQSPFLSEHAPVFTLLSWIILMSPTTRYILKDGYYQTVSRFRFVIMIILFGFFKFSLRVKTRL